MNRKVELFVGGQKVAMNRFVEDVVSNTIVGLLTAFRDVNVEKEIYLKIGPKE